VSDPPVSIPDVGKALELLRFADGWAARSGLGLLPGEPFAATPDAPAWLDASPAAMDAVLGDVPSLVHAEELALLAEPARAAAAPIS
jgi:hypothetical protein